MKLLLNVIRTNPNSIEEIRIEDVASFSVDDNAIYLIYNKGEDETIPLRANDGTNVQEWSACSIFVTRVGLVIQ